MYLYHLLHLQIYCIQYIIYTLYLQKYFQLHRLIFYFTIFTIKKIMYGEGSRPYVIERNKKTSDFIQNARAAKDMINFAVT
jgi:hypothetical protein